MNQFVALTMNLIPDNPFRAPEAKESPERTRPALPKLSSPRILLGLICVFLCGFLVHSAVTYPLAGIKLHTLNATTAFGFLVTAIGVVARRNFVAAAGIIIVLGTTLTLLWHIDAL
jgi:hypothetical protein